MEDREKSDFYFPPFPDSPCNQPGMSGRTQNLFQENTPTDIPVPSIHPELRNVRNENRTPSQRKPLPLYSDSQDPYNSFNRPIPPCKTYPPHAFQKPPADPLPKGFDTHNPFDEPDTVRRVHNTHDDPDHGTNDEACNPWKSMQAGSVNLLLLPSIAEDDGGNGTVGAELVDVPLESSTNMPSSEQVNTYETQSHDTNATNRAESRERESGRKQTPSWGQNLCTKKRVQWLVGETWGFIVGCLKGLCLVFQARRTEQYH